MSEQPSTEGEGPALVWLVEGSRNGRAIWYTANYQRTEDAIEACWFTRKQDAELFAWNLEDETTITEHMMNCGSAPEPGGRPKDGEPYVGPDPILLGIGKVRVAICSDTDDPMRVARELVIYDDGDGPKPVGTPEPEHAGKRADQVGKVLARLRVMNAKGAMVFADDLMTVIENAARADDGFPETKAGGAP
jgi:hypothetical protein